MAMMKLSWRTKRTGLSLLVITLAAMASAACATIEQARATPVHPAVYPLAIKTNLALIQLAWHPSRDFLAAAGWAPCWHRCPTTIYGIDLAEGKIFRLFLTTRETRRIIAMARESRGGSYIQWDSQLAARLGDFPRTIAEV